VTILRWNFCPICSITIVPTRMHILSKMFRHLVAPSVIRSITGRMPRIGKLPVLNLDLLTGQKSGFTPRRGDSLHRFMSNLVWPTGTWVRLAVQYFTPIGEGAWNAAPKSTISTFWQRVASQGRTLDRFLKVLRAFIRLTILH